MTIREQTQQIERETLSPLARLSELPYAMRDGGVPASHTICARPGRILHCKSFRRLKHKTQVFLSPEGTIIVRA